MRTLKTGDIFRGSSYVDLINRTIGTNFNSCFRCLIEMNEFVNCCGLTSWFVFMNGYVHGSSFDWKWKNFLLGRNRRAVLPSTSHLLAINMVFQWM